MAAKSYVKTSRKRLDEFLDDGKKLNRLIIRVGILSGKPRYPAGWAGSKSRDRNRQARRHIDQRELNRRATVRALRKNLEETQQKFGKHGAKIRRAMEKEIRAEFRARGVSSKGLRKGVKSRGTAVAKVAGVLHAGSAYHVTALESRRSGVALEVQRIIELIHRGQSAAPIIRGIGQKGRDAVRRNLSAEGHVDSRRLYRTTQFEVIDSPGEREFKAAARLERRLRAQRRRVDRRARRRR